ncbi:MAG: hypothetical protein HY363_02005 [Candidatus Aenigmarchaeota archaeon]|nr:hypothetical protein [Candidatus Aenigmarchaeota archaeon]
MLTQDEKTFLKTLVMENLKHFRREKKMLTEVPFLKAGHQFEDFLVNLAKKLEDNDG